MCCIITDLLNVSFALGNANEWCALFRRDSSRYICIAMDQPLFGEPRPRDRYFNLGLTIGTIALFMVR